MRAIFISYRREDAEGQAGRLFDDLVTQFGEDSVFMDVSGIEPGRDFRRAIDEQVASCGVLLAVIGKGWFDAKDESGRRRLDDPMDFVRLETASALKRDIPVIPVLVRGATMPRSEQLPPDLAELAYRNAVELTHARWDSDVQWLVKALRPHVELLQKDVGDANADPAGAPPGKASTAATGGSSGERGAGGSAAVDTAQSANKRWRLILVMAVTAIALAVGGYVIFEKVAEKATRDKLAETQNAAVDQGPKTEAASPPKSEEGNVKGKIVTNQNQSISNDAGPGTNGQLSVPNLYGKTYDAARKVLIRAGWQPNAKHVSHGGDAQVQSGNGPIFWHRGYWELEACAGAGAAECSFEFIDPSGRVLVVVTEGEEAEKGEYHATVKQAVLKKK
jgi:TIR domain-containing protein